MNSDLAMLLNDDQRARVVAELTEELMGVRGDYAMAPAPDTDEQFPHGTVERALIEGMGRGGRHNRCALCAAAITAEKAARDKRRQYPALRAVS